MRDEATAFAPATVGNAAVGFDVLGFAVDAVGDTATVRRTAGEVVIDAIEGIDLPLEPDQNTATVGLLMMVEELELDFGFGVTLEKGIPLGSGLGGSAASAVAAVVAANALLGQPLPDSELFRYALAGEAVASGHAHPDNVAPCLYGGLTLAVGSRVTRVPVPDGIWVSLVHPDIEIETKMAREVLPPSMPLSDVVDQMGHLAAFVDACHRGDADAVAEHCVDGLIEPHRKRLVPGFDAAHAAASAAGALAFSLSGSGPTVFALSLDRDTAGRIVETVSEAFGSVRLEPRGWVSRLGADGAELT